MWQATDDVLLYVTAALGVTLPSLIYLLYSAVHSTYLGTSSPNSTSSQDSNKYDKLELADDKDVESDVTHKEAPIRVYYCTQNGGSRKLARRVMLKLRDRGFLVHSPNNLTKVVPDDFVQLHGLHLFIVSTYMNGSFPEEGVWFSEWLSHTINDLGVSKKLLSRLTFGVFGCGDSMYGPDDFNKAAQTLQSGLTNLGGTAQIPLRLGDYNMVDDMETQIDEWVKNIGGELELELERGVETESDDQSDHLFDY